MEETRVSRSDALVIKNTSIMLSEPGRYIVSGEEQQGKTSLLKNAFNYFATHSVPVIYIDAAVVNSSDLNRLIQKALDEQFDGISFEDVAAAKNRVLLFDNLDEIRLNERFRASLLEAINNMFDHIIITCNSSFSYSVPDIIPLDNYKRFELLGLGHVKRAELIEKWVSLGVEESIQEQDLFNQCDETKDKLDAVIRKNIVPAKPIYLLMMLQMFEAGSQQNLDLSSYGHCYQQLIYKSFDNAKISKKDYDTYLNVLTELAWVLQRNPHGINQSGVEKFFLEYQEIYLSVDGGAIIDKLKSNSILQERDFHIQFKYPYLHSFFVAKKIAESYSTSDETKEIVQTLIRNLHREDYANILVFVTHHTKEKWVLDQIDETLKALFRDQAPATLSSKQTAFMDDFISKIPELIIEQREIREERLRLNSDLDKIERVVDEDGAIEENLTDESKKELLAELPANVNKTFKGMELAGQIIRNRHATLPKSDLLKLAEQGAFSGLRFLNFFINVSDAAKTEVIKYVAASLSSNPNLTNQQIEEHATSHFVGMTYGIINGVLRKVATSIGSKEAAEIYNLLQQSGQSPAVVLLNQAISLHFTRKIDIPRLTETYEKLKNNPVCVRILKDLAVQHIYMFPVNYKEKQQLSSLLNIAVRAQRTIEMKKAKKA
jgi:hypothetical protein